MLDADLAVLYGVSTAALNQAVDRNAGRFPGDFCFRITAAERAALKSQSVISIRGRGGRRSQPRAFTEHGVAMLSGVLSSARAVMVNILIMRTFVQLRRTLTKTTELGHRVDNLERQVDVHGAVLGDVLKALRALESPKRQKRREIGFRSIP